MRDCWNCSHADIIGWNKDDDSEIVETCELGHDTNLKDDCLDYVHIEVRP